jgi:TRAP-type C4-dicarboxylate transport system substrate-binding protein
VFTDFSVLSVDLATVASSQGVEVSSKSRLADSAKADTLSVLKFYTFSPKLFVKPRAADAVVWPHSGEAKMHLRIKRWQCALALLSQMFVLNSQAFAGPATGGQAPVHLRVVGGLASVHQYTKNEAPFWTRVLSEKTGGRVVADIVPFDQAGIRGQEAMRLMQTGVIPFGTILIGITSSTDPEWAAPDLAALSSSISELRGLVTAFRPHLTQSLRARYGIELLAVYVYPAQVIFCKSAFNQLADLAGRRIRVATPAQSDFVEALGAVPVRVPFAEVVAHVAGGNADCAITGAMSGNTIGLHEITSYISSMPISWGISAFGANLTAWNGLPPEARAVITAEIPKLEASIWEESTRETGEGLSCNTGSMCPEGRKGRMIRVDPKSADEVLRRKLFVSSVLPRWIDRCGVKCTEVWNRTLRARTGIEAPAPR